MEAKTTRLCPEGHPVAADDTECPVCHTVLMSARVESTTRDRPQFTGYEVLNKLGEGGMGEVYRVRNLELNREEAIKRIRNSYFARPEERRQFRREAEAIARVKHPNIIHIHQVGEAAGQPYFAMEFVEGGTLGRKVARRALDVREAAEIVRKLAEAVNVAHQQHLVHLDLKPDNVLLTPGGEPKITDFGLARAFSERRETETEKGEAKTRVPTTVAVSAVAGGTPGYMAPEQFAAEAAPIGPAADIFGLGATLYRLLTGRTPVDVSALAQEHTIRQWRELLDQAYHKPMTPVRDLRPEVPRDLDAICMRCLQREPQERYPSAAALADDLGRFLRGEPTWARPVGRSEALWLWCRRHPAVAALIALLIASLLTGVVVSSYFAYDAYLAADRASKASQRATREATAARQEAEARKVAKRLADRRGYIATLRLVQMAWEANQPDRIKPLLLQQLPDSTDGIDLRHFEWFYWWRLAQTAVIWEVGNLCQGVAYSRKGNKVAAACLSHAEVRDTATGKTTRVPASAWTVAFSPEGDLLALGGNGTVTLWDLVQNQRREVISLTPRMGQSKWARGIAFSPDGKRLAFGDGPEVRVRTLATGAVATLLSVAEVMSLAYSDDGQFLAVGATDGIYVGDAEKFLQRRQLTTKLCKSLAFHPDSRYLVSAGDNVVIWDHAYGKEERTLPQPDEPVDAVAFSPDGQMIAGACYDRVVRLWNARGGNERGVLRGHTRRLTGVAFSPDGTQLASAGMDDTVRFWTTSQEPGLLPLESLKWRAKTVLFSPDSRRLLRAWEDVSVYDLSTSKVTWSEVPPVVNLESIALSPDGKRLLAGEDDAKQVQKSRILLLDPDTGKTLRTFTGPRATVGSVAFHPDGRQFASVDHEDRLMLWSPDQDTPRVTIQLARSKLRIKVLYRNAAELIVCDPDGGVVVHDAAEGKELYRLGKHQQAVLDLAVTRDGKWLATGSDDNTIKLWDLENRLEVHTLVGHVVGVNAVAFSPDGQRLASVSNDRTLRLWDTLLGQEVLSLPSRDLPLTSVAYSNDGQHLAACAFGVNWRLRRETSEVRVWFAPRTTETGATSSTP